MGEIKVGEYVRTYQGTIARIEDLEFDIKFRIKDNKPLYIKWQEDFGGTYVQKELIVNHSKNIIDLIEVGDYVNGHKILEIHEALAPDDEKILDIGYGMAIFNDSVGSIVTKEQFKNIEYRLEE